MSEPGDVRRDCAPTCTPDPAAAAPGGGTGLNLRALPRALAAAIAGGSGVLYACSFAPLNLPAFEWLALAALFALALAARDARAAAWRGFAFGLGVFGVGVSWVYISLHAHGDLAAPLAVAATAALAALLALFHAAALAAGAACGAPGSLRRAAGLAAAWSLADWLRGVVLTGFPWLATGYAHTDSPLAGYAPLLGVYGVGLVVAVVAALPAWALCFGRAPAQRKRALAVLALAVALIGAGALLAAQTWSEPVGKPLRVRLVQGDIPQDLKFGNQGLETAVERYLPQLRTAPGAPAPDLIVFPESAFPEPVGDLPEDIVRTLVDAKARDGAALIFGAFIVEPGQRYFNSAIGLGANDAPPQRYSKRHLVPFGEFIPWGMHWFMTLLRIPIGDQEAGAADQPPMALAGQQIAVNICFEDLFGAEIRAAWHDPARAPTVLLNISNLAWFDDSIALPQHLQISRMRTLETARPLVRATNTGVTAMIDARGRVLDALPIERFGALEGSVQGMRGTTPFLLWGNAPALVASALLWLACALPGRLSRKAR